MLLCWRWLSKEESEDEDEDTQEADLDGSAIVSNDDSLDEPLLSP